MRFSHQESVPVEGCDQRRWPGLQRVVRDFQRGPSEQAPAKRHSALGRLTALTCRDASLARPWTANPGEKTSIATIIGYWPRNDAGATSDSAASAVNRRANPSLLDNLDPRAKQAIQAVTTGESYT